MQDIPGRNTLSVLEPKLSYCPEPEKQSVRDIDVDTQLTPVQKVAL